MALVQRRATVRSSCIHRKGGDICAARKPRRGLLTMDTERFQRAMALRDSGQVQGALRELCSLSEATADPEEKASLLLNESRCLIQLGNLEGARERFEEAELI